MITGVLHAAMVSQSSQTSTLRCLQDAEAYKATAAHVELSKKMAKRDSATAPQVSIFPSCL